MELLSNKSELYESLLRRLQALLEDESDFIANAANTASLIYHTLPDINWAGFYLCREEQLVLGPFQGKPACRRIDLGRGVCGTAAAERSTLVVADVREFPGHIACDPESISEIVVPLVQGGRLIGVLDIDSPTPGRFDEKDRKGVEAIAACLIAN